MAFDMFTLPDGGMNGAALGYMLGGIGKAMSPQNSWGARLGGFVADMGAQQQQAEALKRLLTPQSAAQQAGVADLTEAQQGMKGLGAAAEAPITGAEVRQSLAPQAQGMGTAFSLGDFGQQRTPASALSTMLDPSYKQGGGLGFTKPPVASAAPGASAPVLAPAQEPAPSQAAGRGDPAPAYDPSQQAPVDESAFQKWYAPMAAKLGISPNPDDASHNGYNYRAMFFNGGKVDQYGRFPPQYAQTGQGQTTRQKIDAIRSELANEAAGQAQPQAAPAMAATPAARPGVLDLGDGTTLDTNLLRQFAGNKLNITPELFHPGAVLGANLGETMGAASKIAATQDALSGDHDIRNLLTKDIPQTQRLAAQERIANAKMDAQAREAEARRLSQDDRLDRQERMRYQLQANQFAQQAALLDKRLGAMSDRTKLTVKDFTRADGVQERHFVDATTGETTRVQEIGPSQQAMTALDREINRTSALLAQASKGGNLADIVGKAFSDRPDIQAQVAAGNNQGVKDLATQELADLQARRKALREWKPGGAQPANAGGQQGSSAPKSVTMAEIQAVAQQYGKPVEQVVKDAKAKGLAIQE